MVPVLCYCWTILFSCVLVAGSNDDAIKELSAQASQIKEAFMVLNVVARSFAEGRTTNKKMAKESLVLFDEIEKDYKLFVSRFSDLLWMKKQESAEQQMLEEKDARDLSESSDYTTVGAEAESEDFIQEIATDDQFYSSDFSGISSSSDSVQSAGENQDFKLFNYLEEDIDPNDNDHMHQFLEYNMLLQDRSGLPPLPNGNYVDFPETSFTCEGKSFIPGVYADMETDCQIFHACWGDRIISFLCPPDHTFNQKKLSCNHWTESNCSQSSKVFCSNSRLDVYRYSHLTPLSSISEKETYRRTLEFLEEYTTVAPVLHKTKFFHESSTPVPTRKSPFSGEKSKVSYPTEFALREQLENLDSTEPAVSSEIILSTATEYDQSTSASPVPADTSLSQEHFAKDVMPISSVSSEISEHGANFAKTATKNYNLDESKIWEYDGDSHLHFDLTALREQLESLVATKPTSSSKISLSTTAEYDQSTSFSPVPSETSESRVNFAKDATPVSPVSSETSEHSVDFEKSTTKTSNIHQSKSLESNENSQASTTSNPVPTRTSRSRFNSVKPINVKSVSAGDRVAPFIVSRVLQMTENIVNKGILPFTKDILAASYANIIKKKE